VVEDEGRAIQLCRTADNYVSGRMRRRICRRRRAAGVDTSPLEYDGRLFV
jgi:hypothetical protein